MGGLIEMCLRAWAQWKAWKVRIIAWSRYLTPVGPGSERGKQAFVVLEQGFFLHKFKALIAHCPANEDNKGIIVMTCKNRGSSKKNNEKVSFFFN